MEWIQRNPKKAVGLSALAVLMVVVFVWGMSKGGTPSADPTLGSPSLAVPTTTPTHQLTALSRPSASASAGLPGLDSMGEKLSSVDDKGFGISHSLEPHRVQLLAGADEGLAAVGWKMPHAKGATEGVAESPGTSWSLDKIEFGLPAYVGLYTYNGEVRGKVWCTVKVDGKVVVHQEAKGPWGQVFCGI